MSRWDDSNSSVGSSHPEEGKEAANSVRPVDKTDSASAELQDQNGFKTIYLEGSATPVTVRPHNKITKTLLRTPIKPVPEQRAPSPKTFKNPLSMMTWGWVAPLLLTGFNRILEINDVFLISEDEKNARRMADYRKKLSEYKAGKRRAYAEFWAILYAIRWPFLFAFITAGCYMGGEIGMSLISRKVIEEVNKIYVGETTDHGPAVGYAIGSTLVQLAFQLCFVWNGYRTRMLAETTRTMLISAIYDKVTKLSPTGRQLYPANKITSVITTDTNRIFMAARWTSMLLIFAPGFGGMLGVLIHNIGVAALPGAGLVLLGIVLNVFTSRLITRFRRKSLPFADARIAAVRETVENMRVIKFYGWESSFVQLIAKARTNETNFLKKLGVVEGLVDACMTSIPQFAGVFSFAVRIIIGKNLPAALTFPSLTLFQLFVPLSMMFSQGVTSHADAWASVKRLEQFFEAPEEPSYVITDGVSSGSVQITDGAFKWDVEAPTPATKTRWLRRMRLYKRQLRLEEEQMANPGSMLAKPTSSAIDDYEEEKAQKAEEKDVTTDSEIARAGAKKFPGLRDLSLDIKPKELIMIVGSIGSGKTTLLSSIAGLVPKLNGSISVGGSLATVMSMWSQNATIRENILFGREYDEKRYAKTVHVCSLESDFEAFNGRDFAEVGERGITLSGGQKARIALARCVYAGGDIVLLDDVLSAVDGRVSNHIFKYCIKGMLKDSTRILVTHNLKLLSEADRVIYMDGEGHAKLDTLKNLLSQEPKFNEMYLEVTKSDTDSSKDPNLKHVRENVYNSQLEHRRAIAEDYDEDMAPSHELGEEANAADTRSIASTDLKRQLSRAPQEVGGSLMTEEVRRKGRVSSDIVLKFLSSGAKIGIFFVPIIVALQCSVATAQAMQSIFLQFWTSNRYHEPNGFYIGFYSLIVFLRAICFVCVAISVCIFCFNSASKLHNGAIENIYRAPVSYFDETPLGRIINRFTDDTANLDTQMYMQLRMTLLSLSMLLASVISIFVYIPWAILALLPIILTGFVLLNYYRASARELKRINSLFRSSMFSLVTESISGMSVILSYRRQRQFADDLDGRIDNMNVSFQINLASQYWLSLRMATASLSVTLIVVLLCVFQVFDLDASKVGMLMSLLPGISISIVILLPMIAELENQMNSVERLHELAYDLPQEAPFHIPETAPPESWPQHGAISIENVQLRYRPGLPNVLNDVSVNVEGGQKVGICGRTGAGKSTILSALFRITELSSGRIVIDGVDIATIGLRDLRTKLAIIPQEPVLFQGTIRSNLDPFNERSDVELWDALRRSGVIRPEEILSNGEVSKSHRFHLDTKADSDGSNFSLGECQLLTLARALVRNAKIIVLDEATATVDFETDKMIQKTIAREFSHCTILCIAHRLQTIIQYDRVLVMDAGKAVEYDHPRTLFDDKSSRFANMCAESGITESDFLASD